MVLPCALLNMMRSPGAIPPFPKAIFTQAASNVTNAPVILIVPLQGVVGGVVGGGAGSLMAFPLRGTFNGGNARLSAYMMVTMSVGPKTFGPRAAPGVTAGIAV